jgi:hypothetical protein
MRSGADAASAGLMVVAAMLIGGLSGYGIGSLVGIEVPLGLVGLFAGIAAGLGLVYARFRDLG